MRAMAPAPDFKLALTRVIEPTGGPGGELATLEDAARFVGLSETVASGTTALGLFLAAQPSRQAEFSSSG